MPIDGTGEGNIPHGSRRRYLQYAGAAVTVGLTGYAGTGQSQVDQFVIGSNHPLSGSLAYSGETMVRAQEYAAKQKNDAGGIESLGGAEVKILRGDNEASQELAGQVSQQLINDGAHVVTGCFNSDATLSATATTEREGIPFVITVAASDRILKERQMRYTYRLQPTTFHYARDWAKFYPELVRGAGHELNTFGHYYIDNAYGSEINEYLKNQFASENDLEMVESTAITLEASDANAQVTRLKNADPDCICLTGYNQDAVLFFQALNDLNYRPTWVSASANVGLVSPDLVQEIGPQARGIIDANYALNPKNPLTSEFRENYREFADRGATPEAGLAWAATQVIFDAVERAGTTDPDALNEAIAQTEMDAKETPVALDGIEFQDNGENKHALAALNQVRGEEMNIEVVYPERFQAMKPRIEPGKT